MASRFSPDGLGRLTRVTKCFFRADIMSLFLLNSKPTRAYQGCRKEGPVSFPVCWVLILAGGDFRDVIYPKSPSTHGGRDQSHKDTQRKGHERLANRKQQEFKTVAFA